MPRHEKDPTTEILAEKLMQGAIPLEEWDKRPLFPEGFFENLPKNFPLYYGDEQIGAI